MHVVHASKVLRSDICWYDQPELDFAYKCHYVANIDKQEQKMKKLKIIILNIIEQIGLMI